MADGIMIPGINAEDNKDDFINTIEGNIKSSS
jgi:hypothetical protein